MFRKLQSTSLRLSAQDRRTMLLSNNNSKKLIALAIRLDIQDSLFCMLYNMYDLW